MAKYEFNGLTTETLTELDKEAFKEIYETVLIKTIPFTVELENKTVELHTFIEDIDLAELGDEDTTDHVITIGIIPSFNSLSENHKEDVLNQYPIEEHENILKDTPWLLYEILTYGYAIPLREVRTTEDKIEETINSAIAVHSAIEGLIGFELDKRINRIGNSGWDFLDMYCNNTNIFKLALARTKA